MEFFIRCPECSNPDVGSKMLLYTHCSRSLNDEYFQKNSKYKNFAPEKIQLKPGISPPMGQLLDELKLMKLCCRTHVMTTIDMRELPR